MLGLLGVCSEIKIENKFFFVMVSIKKKLLYFFIFFNIKWMNIKEIIILYFFVF